MGEWLADQGFSVVGPRWPGHGTTWQDLGEHTWREWERATQDGLDELGSRCSSVIGAGLSAGAAMILHLAVRRPERLAGVVAINALVRRPDLALAPLLGLFVRSVKGVGNDIKKPGENEVSNERIPTRAAAELGGFLRVVDADLPRMTLPLLVFSSHEDHTVRPSNSRRVAERCASDRKELVPLTNSYHVATLDYDAPAIFERVAEFARSLAPAPEP
jgi:carboxylesterase